MRFLQAILNRAKEPSTMAGLSVLGVLFGLPPGTVELGVQIGGAVLATAAILMPEKAAAPQPPKDTSLQVPNLYGRE